MNGSCRGYFKNVVLRIKLGALNHSMASTLMNYTSNLWVIFIFYFEIKFHLVLNLGSGDPPFASLL